jgi:hypothetical protein
VIEFSYEWIKSEFDKLKAEQAEEDRKQVLAKLVPHIFITQGDIVDQYVIEANGTWSKDKYPRELLPALRAYKAALIKELREAEYYIQYMQSECYPLGNINVDVKYKEKEDERSTTADALSAH